MNKLRLDLIPSKPLLLSPQLVKILSKTFEGHEIRILKKRLNKSLRLEISFERRKEVVRQEIEEFQKRARKTRESNLAKTDVIRLMVFWDMLKALRAEANAISKSFLLKITENEAIVETSFRRISELSYVYSQICFETIVSCICEAYAGIGEKVSFMKKEKAKSESC